MKTILSKVTVLIISVLLAANLQAQTLYFCEEVDDDGYPVEESDLFYISHDGSYLTFLVRLSSAIRSEYVNYDIYYNDHGKEVFENTVKQDVESSWSWFWKEVTFYDDGWYKVYVYDDEDYLLCSGSVEIRFK